MIHDQCMMYIPDEYEDGKLVDCTRRDCPLLALRPMQPGGDAEERGTRRQVPPGQRAGSTSCWLQQGLLTRKKALRDVKWGWKARGPYRGQEIP
jgi:hypothetical protein